APAFAAGSAVLPLGVDGRPLGAIALAWPEPRVVDDGERRLLDAIARCCAQALDRARLYDGERRARERSGGLLAITGALASTLTPRAVAGVVAPRGLALLGAHAGALALPTSDDG